MLEMLIKLIIEGNTELCFSVGIIFVKDLLNYLFIDLSISCISSMLRILFLLVTIYIFLSEEPTQRRNW